MFYFQRNIRLSRAEIIKWRPKALLCCCYWRKNWRHNKKDYFLSFCVVSTFCCVTVCVLLLSAVYMLTAYWRADMEVSSYHFAPFLFLGIVQKLSVSGWF